MEFREPIALPTRCRVQTRFASKAARWANLSVAIYANLCLASSRRNMHGMLGARQGDPASHQHQHLLAARRVEPAVPGLLLGWAHAFSAAGLAGGGSLGGS